MEMKKKPPHFTSRILFLRVTSRRKWKTPTIITPRDKTHPHEDTPRRRSSSGNKKKGRKRQKGEDGETETQDPAAKG